MKSNFTNFQSLAHARVHSFTDPSRPLPQDAVRKNISEKRKDGTLVVNEEAPVKKKRRWDVPTPAAGEGTLFLLCMF